MPSFLNFRTSDVDPFCILKYIISNHEWEQEVLVVSNKQIFSKTLLLRRMAQSSLPTCASFDIRRRRSGCQTTPCEPPISSQSPLLSCLAPSSRTGSLTLAPSIGTRGRLRLAVDWKRARASALAREAMAHVVADALVGSKLVAPVGVVEQEVLPSTEPRMDPLNVNDVGQEIVLDRIRRRTAWDGIYTADVAFIVVDDDARTADVAGVGVIGVEGGKVDVGDIECESPVAFALDRTELGIVADFVVILFVREDLVLWATSQDECGKASENGEG